MLAGLKQLPLVSKILFALSLVILLAWVIPTMVNYLKNVKAQEEQIIQLTKSSSKYGITENAKNFNKESFIEDALKNVSKASVKFLGDKSYAIELEVERDKINNFNTFLETLSLRYLVKIVSPITFKEQDKLIEIKMTIQEL